MSSPLHSSDRDRASARNRSNRARSLHRSACGCKTGLPTVIQLREAYADTVRSLIGVLEAKDPYTRGHSERVAGYAQAVGRELGLSETVLERLECAALLHDIGKIAVSRAILVKPDRLSEDEFLSIRRHPNKGADFVSRVPSLRDMVPLVGTTTSGTTVAVTAPDCRGPPFLSLPGCFRFRTPLTG